MKLLFDVPVPALPVVGEEALFPVHRVLCVARNYADHAREMGADDREAPFFFSKPASAVLYEDGQVPYPPRTDELHHEVELVVALRSGGSRLSVEQASDCIYGYAVGIDFTCRDLQAQAKEKGRPWDVAKGFDHSAPTAALTPVSETGLIDSGRIRLKVNGDIRQDGDIAAMVWKVPEVIAELSTYYTLRAGDVIFTGTPSGVGAAGAGDVLEAEIEGLTPLRIRLTD